MDYTIGGEDALMAGFTLAELESKRVWLILGLAV